MEIIKIGEVTKFPNDSHIEFDVVFRYLAPEVLKDCTIEVMQRICNFYSRANKYTCEKKDGVKYVLYNTRISQGKIGETIETSRPIEISDIKERLILQRQKGQAIIDNWVLGEHDELVESLTNLSLKENGEWETTLTNPSLNE